MTSTLLDYAEELSAAFNAAGLDCRIVSEPDRGAGLVVDAPELSDGGRSMRAGCQDLTAADVECVVTVVGSGWAPEQIEQFLLDASATWEAVPFPWHPVSGLKDSGDTGPLYRITVRR